MRTTRLLSVGAGAAVCGVLAASALAASPEVQTPTWQPYTPRWNPASVAPGERSVVIAVTQDSCGSRNLRVAVTQRATGIVVQVSAEQPVYGGPGVISCPGPHPEPVKVELARPLSGRPLSGGGEELDGRREESRTVDGRFVVGNTVPRLVGFSLRDARLAAAAANLPVEVSRRRGGAHSPRVLSQFPRPGTFVEISQAPAAQGPPVLVSLG